MNRTYEIYHHGIKGQKWGVRRFQNEDGTLTSAGQKRYLKQFKRNVKRINNEKTVTLQKAEKVMNLLKSGIDSGNIDIRSVTKSYDKLYFAGRKYDKINSTSSAADVEKARQEFDKAREEYFKECKNLTYGLLGRYSKNKIKSVGFDMVGTDLYTNKPQKRVEDVVSIALSNLEYVYNPSTRPW